MDETVDRVRRAAAPSGLNLIAAIPVARYDDAARTSMRADTIDRNARSIILLANGGGDFWRAFKTHMAANPGWNERANPLDDFTRTIVESRIRSVAGDCTPVYPFIADGPTLNFMELGKLAGLAGPSLLGVVVNPVYGPWIAFRAALLVASEIDRPEAAAGFDPCPTCESRSCVSACPTGAIAYPAGWDIPRCLTYRVDDQTTCAPRCHARAACVIGPEHRYPDEELAYHQMRALRAMRPYYEEHIRPHRA
jgi:epoxyqueuosine reductase